MSAMGRSRTSDPEQFRLRGLTKSVAHRSAESLPSAQGVSGLPITNGALQGLSPFQSDISSRIQPRPMKAMAAIAVAPKIQTIAGPIHSGGHPVVAAKMQVPD